MSLVKPDTLAEMRRRHPDLSEVPDEQVSARFEAAVLDLQLRLRDLGRAILTSLPFRHRT